MKAGLVLTLFAGVVLSAPMSAVHAGEPFDFEYVFEAPGTPIDDAINTVEIYELAHVMLSANPIDAIEYLELEILGLSHESPGDINIFLVRPFNNSGPGIEIMDDRGGQHSISGVDLVFADGEPLLPTDGQITSGRYAPEPSRSFGVFYDGTDFGTNPWRVLVVDDSEGGAGSFDSIALRGRYVPEPASLSLLVLGALAMFRRRR